MSRVENIKSSASFAAVLGYGGVVVSGAELMLNDLNTAETVSDFFIKNPFVISMILSIAAGGIGSGTALAIDGYQNYRRNQIVAKGNSNIL